MGDFIINFLSATLFLIWFFFVCWLFVIWRKIKRLNSLTLGENQATSRGFAFYKFKDANGIDCTLQESSALGPYIWLGTESANPKRLVFGEGWIDATDLIPLGVEFFNRMHLNQEQAKALAKQLNHFAKTGELKQ